MKQNNMLNLLRFINDYTIKFGECPSQAEIALNIGVSVATVNKLLKSAYTVGVIKKIKVDRGVARERNWKITDHGNQFIKFSKLLLLK